MNTDRELLEMAAKAAGIKAKWFRVKKWREMNGTKFFIGIVDVFGTHHSKPWNPLADDVDSLRLAVKLRISLIHEQEYAGGPVIETIEATGPMRDDHSRHCEMLSLNGPGDDEMENVRLAIVRAAAAIGRALVQKESNNEGESNA